MKLIIDVILEKSKKDLEKQEKLKKAQDVSAKILEENPDINIDYLVNSLRNSTLSTVRCAEKLGISPRAFLRLRKKYNIESVAIVKKSDSPTQFRPNLNSKAIRKYYSTYQLKKIPQFEIDLIQVRSGRSLRLNNKFKWKPRGTESNGKLKPRNDALSQNNIFVSYSQKENKYKVRDFNKNTETLMSKQEVDKLNLQYHKLKVFV